MKRLVYGATIGLVGVLAVMAVKLPITHEVSLPGDTGVLHGSQYLVDIQNELKPLRPLMITRGAPSLPPTTSEEFTLDELPSLSLSNTEATSLSNTEATSFGLSLTDESCAIALSDEDVNRDMAKSPTCAEHESDVCTDGVCDNMKTGFVLLDAVMERHPLWMEAVRIEREIETCKSRWQSYVDASVITEEDVLKCLDVAERALDETIPVDSNDYFELPQYTDALESRLDLVEAALTEEADARVQAKAVRLQADLEDRLYAERGRLNNEFDEFRDRTIKESYITIVNTQMKLRLLKLSDAERDALQDELQHLNEDIEKKLSAKEKALDDIYMLYETEETAAVEREVAKYREEQVYWVSSQLQQVREKLVKEVEGFFTHTDHTGSSHFDDSEGWREEISRRGLIELSNRRAEVSREFAERESQFNDELDKLMVGQEQVLDCIKKDIFGVVSSLKNDRDIPIEIIEDNSEHMVDGCCHVDMTQDVISIIRKYK